MRKNIDIYRRVSELLVYFLRNTFYFAYFKQFLQYFSELLKIAEKKQFEPIVIEPKEKKEEERPLTKKQKKELEREREWRERKEGKIPITSNRPQEKTATATPPLKIPKINGASTEIKPPKTSDTDTNRILKENSSKASKINNLNSSRVSSDVLNRNKVYVKQSSGMPEKAKGDFLKQALMRKQEVPNGKAVKISERPIPMNRQIPSKPILNKLEKKPMAIKSTVVSDKPKNDIRPKQFPPKDVKPKQFPPPDLKPKQFPPPDVRRKQLVRSDLKKKPVKRRILDDDEEYDSEMDDFIDDGPEESADYSKYISEIFGYDKSKYRQLNDDDDNMESSFSQQLKEEYISTKIGMCCNFLN